MLNYSQFLDMLPEATLTVELLLMFLLDLFLPKDSMKVHKLGFISVGFLGILAIQMFFVDPIILFGGMYIATAAATVMKIILTLGTIIVIIMGQSWLEYANDERCGEFYILLFSTLLGMFFMVSSGNFLMFFLGLETASVPLACMVALDKYRNASAEAAAKYVLTATFSSGVMLFGLSFVYGSTGTLYYDDILQRITFFSQYKSQLPMLIMGLVFFFSGLGFKLSLVPFHFWTADTYEGAPTPVTAYLSVVSKGAAAFALMFILLRVFEPLREYWECMLYIVIVLSITIANLFAIRQSDIKRFMAYSSISQAGYIVLAVIGGSQMGMASLMYYVLVYVAANLAVFAVIDSIEMNTDQQRTDIAAYNGLYETNPKLAFFMTLGLFSLAGIPPFAGMFSKFFVFMAAAEQGSFWAYFVVFIALINTVVSLYYYLLIVKAMYIRKVDNPLEHYSTQITTRLTLVICVLGIVLLGICSRVYDYLYAASISVI